jgi:hypothetical protein
MKALTHATFRKELKTWFINRNKERGVYKMAESKLFFYNKKMEG